MSELSTDSATGEPLIHVSGLTKEYRSGECVVSVLQGVELRICAGEMVAIMGPSGSGKSTLLFILGLFLAPTRGEYRFLGEDVLTLDRGAQAQFRRRVVGYVFQSCNLVESATVYENLELPLIYAGVKRGERHAMIQRALARVNLSHRIRHPANLLSGGEQQRVAVARALMNNPQLILADEPTGQLDRQHGQTVLDYFRDFVATGNNAMIVVTHDPEVAARCTKVYSLNDGLLAS